MTAETIEHTAQAAADWVRRALAPGSPHATEHWHGLGPVGELEARLRDHFGVPYALTMSSATNALLALALACDLAEREIIMPPQSYPATYGPFSWLGCRVVRAQADAEGNLCPLSAARLITPQTAAIVGTDFQGRPHDQRALRRLCDAHQLRYLSDAACTTFQSTRDGHPASSLADAWVHSFGMGKPTPAGEGAAILTRDRCLYERLLHLSQHPERWRREVALTGWNEAPFLNARMTPLAAVLVLAQLASHEKN